MNGTQTYTANEMIALEAGVDGLAGTLHSCLFDSLVSGLRELERMLRPAVDPAFLPAIEKFAAEPMALAMRWAASEPRDWMRLDVDAFALHVAEGGA